MQSTLKGLTLFASMVQVRGGAMTFYEKHNDWFYGASETSTGACNTLDDADRCGPTDWSTIAGDQQCAEKGTQSPIDIPTGAAAGGSLAALNLVTGSGFTQANFEINSHTTEVAFSKTDAKNKMKITWDGVDYFLVQFHFHSPSENTVGGKYFPMEVHHVHKDAAGNAFVLSVMIKTGAAENEYYKDIWTKIAAVPVGAANATVWEKAQAFTVSPYTGVLPADKSYFYYNGSFTTPPCTTNTRWVVLQNPITISDAQLVAYRTKIQSAPSKQLALCDTARCGGTTPTGVAENMFTGTTWDKAHQTNNRPIQVLTGANNAARAVTKFDAPTGATTKAAAAGATTTTGDTASGANGPYINGIGLAAVAFYTLLA